MCKFNPILAKADACFIPDGIVWNKKATSCILWLL